MFLSEDLVLQFFVSSGIYKLSCLSYSVHCDGCHCLSAAHHQDSSTNSDCLHGLLAPNHVPGSPGVAGVLHGCSSGPTTPTTRHTRAARMKPSGKPRIMEEHRPAQDISATHSTTPVSQAVSQVVSEVTHALIVMALGVVRLSGL